MSVPDDSVLDSQLRECDSDPVPSAWPTMFDARNASCSASMSAGVVAISRR